MRSALRRLGWKQVIRRLRNYGRADKARNIGPIREADIQFGDLTVFVGPQATGKSIFLQILKLLRDKHAIHETMQRFGLAWRSDFAAFLDLYLGEGMSVVWSPEDSRLRPDSAEEDTDLDDYARSRRSRNARESIFLYPGAAGDEPARWHDATV